MARIQKIESDSSFQLSQVLEGTFLTYKTYQNGRVVHKAKLASGNVVEINPLPDLSDYYTKSQVDSFISKNLNYQEASQSLTAEDRDFLICTKSLTITLPQTQQDYLIGISTGVVGGPVNILAHAGQYIQTSSNSYTTGIVLAEKLSTVLLRANQNNWSIVAGILQPFDLDKVIQLLQNYYTKEQIDSIVQGLASDSLIVSLQERISTIQNTPVIHSITGQPGIHIQSNSGHVTLQFLTDSDSQTLKYLSLTSKGLGIKGIDQELQNYYTKEQIDSIVQNLSDSISLSNYYTKEQIDNLIGTLSDSSVADALQRRIIDPGDPEPDSYLVYTAQGIRWIQNKFTLGDMFYVQFSQINSNSTATISGYGIPIGVITNKNTYYPIEKGSLLINTEQKEATIKLRPYLAYDNSAQFTGTWKALFPLGPHFHVVISDSAPASPVQGTIWIKP